MSERPVGYPSAASRLTEIRERLEKATPGPWHRRVGIVGDGSAVSQEEQVCSDAGVGVCIMTHDGSPQGNANAALIASVPGDLAYLLELVEELRTERVTLAKLAHPKPQFFNPLDVVAAAQLRDRILAEGA